MGENDRRDLLVALDPADEVGAVDRVLTDDRVIGVAERPVGQEDAVRERELADVVQQAGGVDREKLVFRAACRSGHGIRVARDGSRMTRGVAIAEREGPQHRHKDPELKRR